MAKQDDLPSLDELTQKISAAKKNPPSKNGDGSTEESASPLRSGVELVAGLAVGGFLGYHADEWLGTKPAFLIAGMLFGMAGGVMNIYRAASQDTVPKIGKENQRDRPPHETDEPLGD